MKLSLVFFILSILMSCGQDTDNTSFPFKQEWLVGDANYSVVKKIYVPKYINLHIEFLANSLCPNSGIDFVVSNSTSIISHKLISTFPYSQIIRTYQNEFITFKTEVKRINGNECVWLGNANVVIQY